MRTLVILIMDRTRASLDRTADLVRETFASIGRESTIATSLDWKVWFDPDEDAARGRWLAGIRGRLDAGGILIIPAEQSWECLAASRVFRGPTADLAALCDTSLGFTSGVEFLRDLERIFRAPLRRKIVFTATADARGFDAANGIHRVPKYLSGEDLLAALRRVLRKCLRTRRT